MKILLLVVLLLFTWNATQAQSYVIKKKKGLYGVRDKKAKKDIIPYEYDAIEEIGIKKSFFILSKNGKQGIVDKENNVIFPLDCDSILPTVPDFPVNYFVYKDGLMGYINHSGEMFPIEYQAIKEVYKKKLILKKKDKCGVFKSSGELIYDFEYNEILSFSDDYLCAKVDSQWLGIRDHKIIHKDQEVLFYNADKIACHSNCTTAKTPQECDRCTKQALMKIIGENLHYPTKARDANHEGTIVLSYVVDEAGEIISTKVIKGESPYLIKECERLIKLFPTFSPAIHEGKKVKYVFVQPFRFILQ